MKATPGQIAFLKDLQSAMSHFDDNALCQEAGDDIEACFNTVEDCDCRKAIALGIEACERVARAQALEARTGRQPTYAELAMAAEYRAAGLVPDPDQPGAWVSASRLAVPVPVFFWLGAMETWNQKPTPRAQLGKNK